MKDIKFFGMGINGLVPCSLVLGALVIIAGFFLSRRKSTALKHAECIVDETKNSSALLTSEKSENSKSGAVGGKRGKNKKRREAQEFTHSWMVGALKAHTGSVLDMKFSSDGKFLASCAEDRTVYIWCTKDLTSKDRKSLRINIDFDYATHIEISPDGKAFIIHKSFGNNIEVFGLRKKPNGFFTSATSVLVYPKKHQEDIVGMDIACNGRFIMTCGKTNDLIIWDLKGEILATIDTILGSTHKAKISPCGRFVSASGFTTDVKVWEVKFSKTGDFKQIGKAFNLTGHKSGCPDFDFSVDSSLMASVSKDGTYRFYDTNIEFEKGQDPRFLVSGTWDDSTPTKLALSPNGEILVISHGTDLSFFSTADGKLDTTIENIGPVACLTFDATGDFVLAAVDKQIRIFQNIPGYRATIKSVMLKLKEKNTSATTERLQKIIAEKRRFLESMGEDLFI